MSTPVFTCGFECGQLGGAGQHWNTTGTVAIDTGTLRSGARALRTNPTAAAASFAQSISVHAGNRHIGRFYIYFATLPDVDVIVGGYGAGNTSGPVVRFKQSESKLYAAVGTTLGASGVSVTTGVWYRIDVDYNTNPAGDDVCDVAVNGTACGQATAAGTGVAAGENTLGVYGAATITADVFYDDVLFSSTSTDYPLGGGYVHHFVPTSDGTHNIAGTGDFRRGTTLTDILNSTTDAYLLIDEVPLDDATPDTDDFVSMFNPPNATDYTEHVFGPAPGIPTPTVGPRAVEVIAGIHQAGTGTGNMEILLNDNGTTGIVYTATTVAGTTSILYKRAHFADPPSAASVWNAAGDGGDGDFRDLRVRFGPPGAVDANPDQYLDCVMIEAEFEDMLRDRAIYPDPVIYPSVVGY